MDGLGKGARVSAEHGHVHGHAWAESDRRWLGAALAVIAAFMVGEVFVGLIAGSLALLSDAAHMLTDAASIALALWAIRLAARPAAGRMTYGWRRVEILSAQANGVMLLLLAAWLAYEAVRRLIAPPQVAGTLVLATALVGMVINVAATWDDQPGQPHQPERGRLPAHPQRFVRVHRHRGGRGDHGARRVLARGRDRDADASGANDQGGVGVWCARRTEFSRCCRRGPKRGTRRGPASTPNDATAQSDSAKTSAVEVDGRSPSDADTHGAAAESGLRTRPRPGSPNDSAWT